MRINTRIKRCIQHTVLYQYYKVRKMRLSDKRVVYFLSDKASQIKRMIELMPLIPADYDNNTIFYECIDEDMIVFNNLRVIGNTTPDYKIIIDSSISSLINKYSFSKQKDIQRINCLLKTVKKRVISIINEMEERGFESESNLRIKQSFINMIDKPAQDLFDALQRIVFWSDLFWQSGHKLVGLGRLDVLLDRFSNEDYEEELLVEFIKTLHKHYKYKSAELLGDIGQIIVLGGMDSTDSYFYNRLTISFINAIKKAHVTDPKIILRVSKKTPESLIDMATKCIATGVGSPLLSNDDVIIPCLINFGYDKEDAYNYVTSACWEPLSYGNSLEQNNIRTIEFSKVFSDIIINEGIKRISTFEELMETYLDKLREHVLDIIKQTNKTEWEEDPLFSIFTMPCFSNTTDISKGGAKYNDYGILSVGLGNVVDSLINIKKYVFEKNEFRLDQLYDYTKTGDTDLLRASEMKLKQYGSVFGTDHPESIQLTNKIVDYVNEIIKTERTTFNGFFKWGLSAPGYIKKAYDTGATFDGRCAGDPLNVHISSNGRESYTSLVNFASQIHYEGTNSNGNVVDFFVSPRFLNEDIVKFELFIKKAIKLGVFQMQINVVDSKTLIAAKLHPNEYSDLIVRVWGFSAYFNDLPEDYKDVLIRRAQCSEGFNI